MNRDAKQFISTKHIHFKACHEIRDDFSVKVICILLIRVS